MPDFLWNPIWETGFPDIDRQHQELLRRMESLAMVLAGGGELLETERTLLHMGEYVEFHFQAEEALMRQFEYPGLPLHQAHHDALRSQVRSLVDAYVADHELVPMSVMDFLVGWLSDHIDKHDRAMAAFFRKCGSSV